MKPSLGDDFSRTEIIRCLNEWLNPVLLIVKLESIVQNKNFALHVLTFLH